MNRFSLLLLLLFFSIGPVFGEGPWVSLSVPESDEPGAILLLESRGIHALGWSNAVVEVSAFEGLETVPVSRLTTQLLPQDPRWDPWLKEIAARFHPSNGFSRVWVSPGAADLAGTLLGRSPAELPAGASPPTPPLVTGWTLVSLTLLYTVLMVSSGLRYGWPTREPRRWLWVPVALLLLIGGLALTGSRGVAPGAPAVSGTSWIQHRWFQETWPWGSQWEDYPSGKPWTYPSYEHKNGRLTEVATTLDAGSEAWKGALEASLDPRHAARIFGSFLP